MRERFRSSLGLLEVVYISLLIVLLDKYKQLGLGYEDDLIQNIFDKINFESTIGQTSIVFFIMFFSMNYFIAKSNMNEIIIYEDDKIENKINKKLILYKGLIVVSLILGIYFSQFSKDIDISCISIYLIISSILIHYNKKGYLQSYMYNRQLQWYKEINNEEIYDDTNKWRKKQKFNGFINIDKKYRYKHIVEYIPTIIIAIILIIPKSMLIRIFMMYILLINIASVIENLFNGYTSISGVCTSITENRRKNNITYNIIVTDYENKLEKKFNINDIFSISEMDKVEVVYGVFSKRCIMINNIINAPAGNIMSGYFGLFVLIAVMIWNFGNYYFNNDSSDNNYVKEASKGKYEDTYEDIPLSKYNEYDSHVILNGQEILDLYQNTDKDSLEYAILEPDEYYVESTFNTFEHYDGMIDSQIIDNKKYGRILYPYSYDKLVNNITLQKETAMYLISLVMPIDSVEEKVLTNKNYGIECRVYKSSKGTFVVRMQKNQYFNGTQPYYNEDEIVDLLYLKLIE